MTGFLASFPDPYLAIPIHAIRLELTSHLGFQLKAWVGGPPQCAKVGVLSHVSKFVNYSMEKNFTCRLSVGEQ